MGTYGYNDWEQKSWEETVLAEIRERRMYRLELDLIGTPELGTMR